MFENLILLVTDIFCEYLADVNIINFVGNKIKIFLQSCKQR